MMKTPLEGEEPLIHERTLMKQKDYESLNKPDHATALQCMYDCIVCGIAITLKRCLIIPPHGLRMNCKMSLGRPSRYELNRGRRKIKTR
jgi:hypothetical protein